MKIVFNTDHLYLHGGIEKTMATKANYFANLPDVEVYIVTTEQQGKPPCYILDDKITLIDLSVNYNRELSYFSKSNLKKVFNHYRRQKLLFKDLKPDIIISPNFNFDHYWLPFISNNAKVIKERHASRYFEEIERHTSTFLKRVKFSFNDWIDAKYDYIIVLNDDEKEYVRSKNSVVIPNSITIPLYKSDLKNKKVIAAGRISQVKAFDELIEAWKLVNEQFPDWVLDLYGEDYLDTKVGLKKLIDSKGLQDVIFFKKSVPDLPLVMSNYSIYAMSSITECFPMVLLEALSVGTPIVSYDCPNGPRNIITDNEDGLLAKYRDTKNLAEQLMVLIKDETKRLQMGAMAKQNIKRFDNQNVMKLWHKLLNLKYV